MSATLYFGESGSVVCYAHAGSTLQSAIDHAPTGRLKFLGMNNEVFELLTDAFRDYTIFMNREHGMTEINCEVCK